MKMANAFVQQGFPKFTGDDLFPSLPVYSIHWFSHFKATPSKCWRQMVMLHKFVTCISKSRFIVLFPDVAGCPFTNGFDHGPAVNHHQPSHHVKSVCEGHQRQFFATQKWASTYIHMLCRKPRANVGSRDLGKLETPTIISQAKQLAALNVPEYHVERPPGSSRHLFFEIFQNPCKTQLGAGGWYSALACN